MEEEVLEQVAEQEPVVETPAENVQEEPELVEEPVAEPEPQPAPEPIQVYTKGKWADLELLTEKEMEVGKTYHIKVSGHCQFAVSAEKPTAGIATNEITFTKQDGLKLWIKTGE
jgi:hypothetical protein